MLISPPGSLFSYDTPKTDSLDIEENPCAGSWVDVPVASNENYDQEVNFVGLCDGTEDVGLAGYIGDQQNQLHEENLVSDLEFETEATMTSTPQMCHSLLDPLADDAIPTETATSSGSMNSNLSEIRRILGTSSIGDGSGRVPTRTGKPGKPGKMGRHFPVREKSGNFEQTGKVREKSGKITQNTGKLREFQTNIIFYFLVVFKLSVYYFAKMHQIFSYKINF